MNNSCITVPLLDLPAQFAAIEQEIRAAIERVLASQHFILGPEVESLEREIADYCQCRHAIGVSSGTDALLIALMAIGIEPGDEVITSPYTFFATAGSIVRLGARPVFVDIDPRTYNIDVDQIERVISGKSRAILPIHLFGQMADMAPIMDVAKRHGLRVIEDAAQAIGAEYRGARAGSIGDVGCFSFFPSKNLGAFGDGGMVTTNDDSLADRLQLLRNHGHRPKYYHKMVGGNFRLDALQAAILRAKLPHLDRWTERRQSNAQKYRRLFESLNSPLDVQLPWQGIDRRHIYNQFVIRVTANQRAGLMAHLKDRHIGTEVYYPCPMHLQECFKSLGYTTAELPAAESAALETLALPIFPELTDIQQRAVVDAISSFFAASTGQVQSTRLTAVS